MPNVKRYLMTSNNEISTDLSLRSWLSMKHRLILYCVLNSVSVPSLHSQSGIMLATIMQPSKVLYIYTDIPVPVRTCIYWNPQNPSVPLVSMPGLQPLFGSKNETTCIELTPRLQLGDQLPGHRRCSHIYSVLIQYRITGGRKGLAIEFPLMAIFNLI